MTIPQFMGVRVRRREDPALVTGAGKYVADFALEETVHAAMVRSPVAHGRIVRVDRTDAQAAPGVVAVFLAEDILPKLSGRLPAISGAPCGEFLFTRDVPRSVMAGEKVLFTGEIVAVVLAETAEQAIDACELLQVEIDPLPAVIDPNSALEESAPKLHDELPDNRVFEWTLEKGAVDEAFATATHVLELPVVMQRLIPNAMEPRAALAHFDHDRLKIWSTTQIPHLLQQSLTQMLSLESAHVRVIAPEVGGGFGAKANIYPEEVLVAVLSRHLGRPVRWCASRSEDYLGTTHGRDQQGVIRLAADSTGRIQAVDLDMIADCGAWLGRVSAAIAPFTGALATGVYDIGAIRARAVGVLTNKAPMEPYRGAGRPEACFLIERAIDRLAHQVGLDTAEVRRRNFIPADRFPYTNASGLHYDSGNYQRALELLLKKADYRGLRRRQQEDRVGGKTLLTGIGLASYVEICGFGPWEFGKVEIDLDGRVNLYSGSAPQGQGHATSWAQIVADQLQVAPEDVSVYQGDTALVAAGIGTFGSRSASVGGSALVLSCQKVVEGARAIAGHLLEAAVDDVELIDGHFQVVGAPEHRLSWPQLAASAHQPEFPAELKGLLIAESKFRPQGETYPFGVHLCVVNVDRQTGTVRIARYLTVDDCGRVINPLLVEGQIHGGIAQGVGQALLEEARYDEGGNLASGTLLSYALPRFDTLPLLETSRTETPTPLNPLGVKGVGEAATIGSTPAVVNAVIDALKPLGILHLDMPLTPARIWKAIRDASESHR